MNHILLVDDEEKFIQSLITGLSDYKDHFEVLAAKNGKEAVEILESTPMDLVVTDLKMPVMDGFELLAYIVSYFPSIPIIVMSAFATQEVEERLRMMGIFALLEKPIDFEQLASAILQGLEVVAEGGSLTGISLVSFIQLIEMEQKTCLLEVRAEDGKKGLLYFNRGELYDAVYNNINGEEAVLDMVALENPRISFMQLPKKKIRRHITQTLMSLLLEGSRRKDEAAAGVEDAEPCEVISEPDSVDPVAGEANVKPPAEMRNSDQQVKDTLGKSWERDEETSVPNKTKENRIMASVKEKLEKFKDVDGFQGVGIFTPTGETLEMVSGGGLNIEQVGILANNALINSQKTSLEMGTGRGQLLHIEAEKAHILVRCLNEGTHPLKSEPGKAHFHTVVVLSLDGQVGMGKMRLNQLSESIAEDLR